MNTIGRIFRLTSFGESHGAALGGVVDGMPAGLELDLNAVQLELDRRRPGAGAMVSQRREPDTLKVLSGLFEGRTTGTPIAFMVENSNARSQDYERFRDVLRTGHADATYLYKYGIRDHRGGGRSSARATVAVVAAGAMARQLLVLEGISVTAYTSQIGTECMTPTTKLPTAEAVYASALRCPDPEAEQRMESLLAELISRGDTTGGVVSCVVRGCPAGLGEPLFGKLQARLAEAMMSINAVKGFEYGDGFAAAAMRGSELYAAPDTANHSGGILGGISNGCDITMRVAFKPIATLMQSVMAMHTDGSVREFLAIGRHDACAVPRAVPVVEAMVCLTIADALLLSHLSRV